MLQIKGSLEFDALNVIATLTDTTGVYNASTNPKGYGTINKDYTQVLETNLRIIKPDGVIVDITMTSGADFIPRNTFVKELTLAILDESGEFQDGIYQVGYVVWMKVDDTTPAATYQLYRDSYGVNKILGTNSHFTSVLLGFGDTSVVRVLLASDTTIYEDFSITQVVDALGMILDQSETKFGTVAGDGDTIADVALRAGYSSTFAALNKNQFLKCFLPKMAGISLIGKKGCGQPDCCSYNEDKLIQDLTELHVNLFKVEAQLEFGMWNEANKNMRVLGRICNNLNCGCK